MTPVSSIVPGPVSCPLYRCPGAGSRFPCARMLPPGTGWAGSASLGGLVLGTRRVKRMSLSQGQFLDCRSINRSWVSNLLATRFHSLPVFSCFFLQGGTCNCCSLQPCSHCWERKRSSRVLPDETHVSVLLQPILGSTHTPKKKEKKKERRENKPCPGRDSRILVCPESLQPSLISCLAPPEPPQSHPLLGQVKPWFKHCKLMWKTQLSSLGKNPSWRGRREWGLTAFLVSLQVSNLLATPKPASPALSPPSLQ